MSEENTYSNLPTSFHFDQIMEIPTASNGNQESVTCQSCNEGRTAISYCFVCQDCLCSTCDKAHRRLRATRDHESALLQNELLEDFLGRPVMCLQEFHGQEPLNHFCQQCSECICEICCDESHWQHDVVDIKQAAREGKKQLEKVLKEAEEKMIACQDEMEENEDRLESRKNEIGAARRNVKAIVQVLLKSLKDHEKAVLTKLDDICEQQQKRHSIKQRNLELFVTRLRSPVELGKVVLRRNVDVEIVNEQKAIIDRCEDLLNSKETKALELPFVNYVIDEEMCQSVQTTGPGDLIVSSTDPSQTAAHGEDLRDPAYVVGMETYFEIRTKETGGTCVIMRMTK